MGGTASRDLSSASHAADIVPLNWGSAVENAGMGSLAEGRQGHLCGGKEKSEGVRAVVGRRFTPTAFQ
jgi:hypothetical protein